MTRKGRRFVHAAAIPPVVVAEEREAAVEEVEEVPMTPPAAAAAPVAPVINHDEDDDDDDNESGAENDGTDDDDDSGAETDVDDVAAEDDDEIASVAAAEVNDDDGGNSALAVLFRVAVVVVGMLATIVAVSSFLTPACAAMLRSLNSNDAFSNYVYAAFLAVEHSSGLSSAMCGLPGDFACAAAFLAPTWADPWVLAGSLPTGAAPCCALAPSECFTMALNLDPTHFDAQVGLCDAMGGEAAPLATRFGCVARAHQMNATHPAVVALVAQLDADAPRMNLSQCNAQDYGGSSSGGAIVLPLILA